MSTASKITLATTSLAAIGIVVFVHYGQHAEKAVCLLSGDSWISFSLTTILGYARWSNTGYGTAKDKKGATSGF